MDKYECSVCGYVYDPEQGDSEGGIAPGTSFDQLPDDWQRILFEGFKKRLKRFRSLKR